MSNILAERFQRIREEKGLTQAQLADASGLNIWAIRNWEQGKREPGAAAITALARALKVSSDYLLGLKSK